MSMAAFPLAPAEYVNVIELYPATAVFMTGAFGKVVTDTDVDGDEYPATLTASNVRAYVVPPETPVRMVYDPSVERPVLL